MIEVLFKQPQTFSANENFRNQPLVRKIIFNWAQRLPGSPIKILDLAAGFATDAFILNQQGVRCFAQDNSFDMIDSDYNQGNVFAGAAEALAFPSNTLSGALLKDSLIFISPDQRQQALQELKRVLIPGGSLLVISEINHQYDIRYRPAGLHACNNQSLKCPTFETFIFHLNRLKQENAELQGFEFPCDHKEIQCLAQQYRFNYQLIRVYSENHPLAKENRWGGLAGFIAKLTKLS